MSTSTSRELTIRALESEPHTFYHDSLLHRICFHFSIVKNAQGHAFKVTSFLIMDIEDHTTCVAFPMIIIVHLGSLDCTLVRDLASTCHFNHSMHHDIYMPCVLHPILGLLAPLICLVATMSSLHICHVPLIATCLT